MTRTKCSKCNVEAEHYHHKEGNLCKYHWWQVRPEYFTSHNVKEYRKMHPVRIARWRKLYPDLDALIS